MFATFDPPPATMKDAIGHYCLVTLNLREKRFELLDSLNEGDSAAANVVFRKMVRNIKKSLERWQRKLRRAVEPSPPGRLCAYSY